MTVELRSPGKTTVSHNVLLDVARLTALQVDGVHSMGHGPAKAADGILKNIEGELVHPDIYLILNGEVNLRQVARGVQSHLSRAISEMIGLQPGHIDVHVEDIYFPLVA